MAIEIRPLSFQHEPATNKDPAQARSPSKSVTFDNDVDKFHCAIAGFELAFIGQNAEHPLQSEQVKIVAQRRAGVMNIVDVQVQVGLKDGSGNYDDRYRGTVDVLVIAQTSPPPVMRAPILGHRKVALRASNGRYLSAEAGGGAKLVANKATIGDEERFEIELLDNAEGGPVCDASAIALRAWNGKLVCAEDGGGREVIANRDQIGVWETFTVRRVSDLPPDDTRLYGEDRIALRTRNGDYLRAEPGGVRADRPRVGTDEIYTLVPV